MNIKSSLPAHWANSAMCRVLKCACVQPHTDLTSKQADFKLSNESPQTTNNMALQPHEHCAVLGQLTPFHSFNM